MPTSTPRVRNSSRPAVFLDKDGTLVTDVPYNVDIDRIRLYPEVPAVLAEFARAGYRLIVISNQPGVAHGYFDEAALERAGRAIKRMLAIHGVMIDGFHYCPHHPEGRLSEYAIICECRKPRAGLIARAAHLHDVDIAGSWMVGDILNDIEAGNRAGCRTILVDRGNETEWLAGEFRQPDWVVSDLRGTLRHIVSGDASATSVAAGA